MLLPSFLSLCFKLKKSHTSFITSLWTLDYGLLRDQWSKYLSPESKNFSNLFHLHFFELVSYNLQEYGPPVTHFLLSLLKYFPSTHLRLSTTIPSSHLKNMTQDPGWGANPVLPMPVLLGVSVAFWHIVKKLTGNSVDWLGVDESFCPTVVTSTIGRLPF